MQRPIDEEGDELSLKKQLLDELMEYARGGMARDMRQRFGKPLDDAPEALEGAGEEVPEDAEIPGVEASPDGEVAEGQPAAEEGGMDAEKLKALLASMKGG